MFMYAFIILFVVPVLNGFPVPRTRTLITTKRTVKCLQTGPSFGHVNQPRQYGKRYGTLSSSDRSLSSVDDETTATNKATYVNVTEIEEEIQQEQEAVSQQIEQEKEELQAAVKEVKDAVVEVSQSAKNLGGAVISNGPGIFAKFFKLWVSEEMRLVCR